MYRIKYICQNCGKCFYFHGETAEAMQTYWRVSAILRDSCYVNIPLMGDILSNQAKCCESPVIGLTIPSKRT